MTARALYRPSVLKSFWVPPKPLSTNTAFITLRCASISTLTPPPKTPPRLIISQTLLPLLPQCHRPFHTSALHSKDHRFDTLKFVERLRSEGFSEAQSEALMRAFCDTIEESIQNLTRTMVPREDQEKIHYTQKVDFEKLRLELTALHGNELNPLKNEQERLSSDISRLTARLREEVQRAQSSIKLDLNLEKGRIREESSVHELKIKETDTRIEKEVGDLRGMLEAVKFSTLQWLIGVCTGTAALLLGVWRLLM